MDEVTQQNAALVEEAAGAAAALEAQAGSLARVVGAFTVAPAGVDGKKAAYKGAAYLAVK
jgi:hypothetical protein